MKKPILTILIILLAAVVISAIAVSAFRQSEWGAGLQAYQLLQDFLRSEEFSIELAVNAQLSETPLNFSVLVERSLWEGRSITTVTGNGTTLCCTEGVVLFENGMAYRLSDEYPDYSQLPEQSMALYKNVQIEARDGVYAITASGDEADAILATLLPGMEADADTLCVELVTEEDQLTGLRFYGQLTGNGQESSVSATISILGTQATVPIPDAVQEAIRAGAAETATDLSDDLLRLLSAWAALRSTSTAGATLTLSADCGVLNLRDALTLYRQDDISAIEKNGATLYFTDNAVCDENGNMLSVEQTDPMQPEQLMNLVWQLCMDGQLTCNQADRLYSYTLTLDEAGMEAAAQAIAPEIAQLNIAFQSGSIVLELRENRLQCIRLTVSGQMDMLLVQIPASLSAAFTVLEDAEFQIPGAVLAALG